MNKKGFSLVELLATIIILSLVLIIAIPGVNSISNVIKKAQLNNVLKDLEVNGSRYAFDTGETIFFAEDLLMYGYIDSEENDIIDPITNKSINCYGIKAVKEGEHYKANIINDSSYQDGYEINGVCNRNLLINRNSDVAVSATIDGVAIENGVWTNLGGSNVTITANIDCDPTQSTNRCLWNSSRGNIIGSNKFVFNINNTKVLNTQFKFKKISYTNGSVTSSLSASFNLMIDREVPYIDLENSYYSNGQYTIIANDGTGSGISGYCISSDSTCTNYSSNNKITIGRGSYQIWVKDKAGNVANKTVAF